MAQGFTGVALVGVSPLPLTTKGDLLVFSTTNDRLPVSATNGAIPVADSSATAGIAYKTDQYRLISRTIINQGTTSYTAPAGARALLVQGWGAGGGGAGVAQATASQETLAVGGGGGAYSEVFLTTLTGPFTCVVGLGGAGGAAGANNGTAGTDTTFLDNAVTKLVAKAGGAGLTASGLATGTSLAISAGGGAFGAASGGTGDVKFDGEQGDSAIRLAGTVGKAGRGGASAMGGNGAAAVTGTAAGIAGNFPGGGGGGALDDGTAARAGGAGANGVLIVWAFA